MALNWSPKQFELARAEDLAVVATLASSRPWIVSGLVLSAGTGLNVAISAGDAWINGYYVDWDASSEEAVTASATNHVWIELTRDGNDNVTAVDFVVNTTGVAPTGDNVKLGTAIADGSAVTSTATTGRAPETQIIVESVLGRTGAVVAVAGDYEAVEIDYDNTTSGLVATEVQAAVDELAARPAPLGWETVVFKQADENTSSAMQDDNDLFVSVDADKIYMVHFTYLFNRNTGSILFEFSAPSGSTFTGQVIGYGTLNTGNTWNGTRGSGIHITFRTDDNADLLTSNAGGTGSDLVLGRVDIYGILDTSSTAGTLQFRFGTASGNVIILKGSLIRVKES